MPNLEYRDNTKLQTSKSSKTDLEELGKQTSKSSKTDLEELENRPRRARKTELQNIITNNNIES
eukprot:5048754-Heterocapsa_arctica.AAC.1